jgi:hypothetical protein
VRRKVEAGVGNPLLASLKMKRDEKIGFSSNALRFQNNKVDEAETFLGPGYYEQGSSFQPKINSLKAATHNVHQVPRFPTQKVVDVPGPGHYTGDDNNQWFKRTYNMIFTE